VSHPNSEPPSRPTVVISGAGIAGPALAFWLTSYGYRVVVVETAPGIRPGGHPVDPGRCSSGRVGVVYGEGQASDGGGLPVLVPHQRVQRRAALQNGSGHRQVLRAAPAVDAPPKLQPFLRGVVQHLHLRFRSSLRGSVRRIATNLAGQDQRLGLPGEALGVQEGVQRRTAGPFEHLEDQGQAAVAVPAPRLGQAPAQRFRVLPRLPGPNGVGPLGHAGGGAQHPAAGFVPLGGRPRGVHQPLQPRHKLRHQRSPPGGIAASPHSTEKGSSGSPVSRETAAAST